MFTNGVLDSKYREIWKLKDQKRIFITDILDCIKALCYLCIKILVDSI